MDITTPLCRSCLLRGNHVLATWVLNDDTISNWYLCDYHSGIIGTQGKMYMMGMEQLPNARQIRLLNTLG